MTPTTGPTFGLGLIASHLQAQLVWATQHRLSAGSHATSTPTSALALWLVKDGNVRVSFRDGHETDVDEITLRAGDAVLMRADRHRTISALQNVTWLSAGLTLRLFSQDYTQQLFPPVFRWHPEETENSALPSLLEVARANCRVAEPTRPAPFPMSSPPDPLHQWVADGVARLLIHHVWQRFEQDNVTVLSHTNKETPHWLLAVLLHISQTPATASVESMSAIAGISQSQFNRVFRRYVGTTPQKQLTTVRLQRAAHLLLTTEKTTAAIARSVGFESLSHFTRLFTEQYELSPARYRTAQRSLRL